MAKPIITINGGMPDPESVSVNPSGVVLFKSGDKKKYSINFDSGTLRNNAKLSSDLPLQIPDTGDEVELKVKSDTPKATYLYAIFDANGNQCWPIPDPAPGDVPPKVIVD